MGEYQGDGSGGVLDYFTKQWMEPDVVKMWSDVFRTERSIFEDCNTNMLVEARVSLPHLDGWHHLLKSMFLLGKCNRRMDHLLHTLINDVVSFFIRKQHVHESGFKGDDLQTKKRRAIVERA
ncbi:hypothetical protein C8F01DRAFT_980872, partial [Mycena amicta]